MRPKRKSDVPSSDHSPSPRGLAALATPSPDPSESGLPSVRKHRTLEELAYEDIRQSIAAGRFAPGDRIVVNALAAASGISKIPVMQALRRLQTEGFVHINPHKDVVVRKPSPQEYRERFLLIATLGALCIREAGARITPEVVKQLRALQREIIRAQKARDTDRAIERDAQFHRILWEIAGLPNTLRILQNLWDQGEYYRTIMNARRGGFAQESLDEHEAILNALEAQDFTQAAKNLERHHLAGLVRLAETT
jgi:DNA-binding GntR family transcriptional regulator